MSRSNGTKELQWVFAWPTPDLARLGKIVEEVASSWTPGGLPYAQHTRREDGWTMRTTYHSFEDWALALKTELDSVWVTVNDPKRDRKITASWDAEYARFEVTIGAEADTPDADLQAVCQNFTSGLSLVPWDPKGKGKLGDARRYFLSKEATLDWYVEAIKLLQAFAVGTDSFWGRLACRQGEVRSERGYGSLDQWRASLVDAFNGKEVEQSYLSFQSPDRRVTFDLDHIRDLLSLDVQSTSAEELDKTHSLFVQQLQLSPAPENAWRYRRWGRTYEIKWGGEDSFANQLKLALHNLFGGRKVALNTAVLHLGSGDEQVLSFKDVDSFVEALGKARGLSEIHLVANGPRGEFIGVHVERNLTRMRLLANVEFSSFRKFENELSNALRSLKVKEMYDTETGGGSEASWKDKKPAWVAPALTAAITLATGLLGTEFFKALREEPVLTIDIPVVKEGLAELASPNPVIRWTFKEPRVLGRPEINTHKLATVDVTRQADGEVVADGKTGEGQYALDNLIDGDYSVRVTAPGTQPRVLLLRVKRPAAKPTTTHAAVSDKRRANEQK